MFKLKQVAARFTQFYHPTPITFKIDDLATRACSLAYYVELYRNHGHHYAQLDPLSLYNTPREYFPRPTDIGIKFQDRLTQFSYRSPVTTASKNVYELYINLQKVYQGTVGVQFSHIESIEEKDWLYHNYEVSMLGYVPKYIKQSLAKVLVYAYALDHFLHKKFVTFKRYSGEGAYSTVVALYQLFHLASQKGFYHIVLGMPHRGRLNLLVNVLQYDARNLFRKISGKSDTPVELHQVIDDATSHVAQSVKLKYGENEFNVSLIHNPSHLEAQNPVSMGKTRSKQHIYGKDKVINVQVHGDAAFSAQGIVYESFCLNNTPNFYIDGSIHIITNNQIGYTTRPIDGRGSKYCSDICKAFDTPILHVNSDCIYDVYRVVKLAVEYRTKFKKDIMIDLVCYRKYGHNEVDYPYFTQPQMYHRIRKYHVPSPEKYTKLLIQNNILPNDFYEITRKEYNAKMYKYFTLSKEIVEIKLYEYMDSNRKGGARAFTDKWTGFKPSQFGYEYPTGYDISLLKEYALASVSFPDGFKVHPRIKKYHIDYRIKSLYSNSLNWASCESLAFFSLSAYGYNIRMTGQDVERGTFSQRHAVLTDQKSYYLYNSLYHFAEQQSVSGIVYIRNSALTYNAAMSYEYGYSLDHPNNLTIWYAQFGDFFNTAQVVIDTFLTNSENKWMRQTGLTLLLPHGYDGAGPEHSSCRIYRFLQLANSDGSLFYSQLKEHDEKRSVLKMSENYFVENIQEANFSLITPTKPANFFHALRRQMKRNFRKPLIVASPKGLLRLNECVSPIEHLGPGSKFYPILKYHNCEHIHNCTTVFLTAGKFVYDIQTLMRAHYKCENTCLLAIEELFPFPEKALYDILSVLPEDAKVYWLQEENFNSGPFEFVSKRVQRVLNNLGIKQNLQYVGRRALAATAVGSSEKHKKYTYYLKKWISSLIE